MDTNEKKNAEGEIVLYQPDATISMNVLLDTKLETVWLTQEQIAQLFGTQRPAITKHLAKIYQTGELTKETTCSILEHMGNKGNQKYSTIYYNLDAILSVGYRVNSVYATTFRRWATKVIKDHMLRGYSVNHQMVAMQERNDQRFTEIEQRIDKQQEQIDFFIKTNLPPVEMVFFNGQFFSARVAIENLIKSATKRVVIIDHYVDAKTFDMLDVRRNGVKGTIITQGVGDGMKRLRDDHNRQKGVSPVEVLKWRVEPHDRFLIIDDSVYHCGHSLNATGNKLSAIMLMGISSNVIMKEIL